MAVRPRRSRAPTSCIELDGLWGEAGLGGSYNWDDDKYSIYGEGSVMTSLADFGDSYALKGTAGFRVKW